ncbi:MAG: fibronectin type III domain-containing protein, partial [candidate division Zixibacteria bacterium]|nr:fibronectin type III domain-containing protein [candidate division Zixibacteria bacterium]
MDYRTHTVGDLRAAIANDGTFGSGSWMVPWLYGRHDFEYNPSFEFPAGSFHDYLYAGSLWVGGIVGTDTLVSAAINGNSGTSPLKIEQVSHAWQSAPYDRFIIIEYTVKNISADTIHQTRIGLFADADIYSKLGVLSGPGYADDVAGYLRDQGIAYAIDNDGDPHSDSVRIWNQSSSRGAIGIAPIFVDPPSCCTTFNWWTAFGAYFDWSPSHANSVCWQCPSAVPPLRDVQKYYIMHNGEIDYDQMWSTVDFSSDGWKPPLPQSLATNIAKGIDTRYLLAFGQWDLAPGDSIRFVAALVAGDLVHQSPGDFAQYFDPLNPSAFYHRLDFRDLIDQTTRARTLYLSGFDLTGASPAQIHATVTGDRTVKCRWTPAPFHGATGYRLYRRSLDDSGWTLLATLESDERGWEDSSLEIARTYQYSVSALYSHGLETPKSHFAAVTPGYPPIKPQIEAVAGSDEVTINWVVPRPGPTFSPPKYLDIFRHAEFDTGSVLVHRVVFPADSGETTSRAHDPAAIVKSASS